MKALVLPLSCNKEIREVLRLEYVREDITWLLGEFNELDLIYPGITERVSANVVDVLNTIILDNVLRFIKSGDLKQISEGILLNNLGLRMEVGLSHLDKMLDFNLQSISDKLPTIEYHLMNVIAIYLNGIYQRNVEEFSVGILTLLEELIKLSWLGSGIIRSDFVSFGVPVVYVRKEVYECITNSSLGRTCS